MESDLVPILTLRLHVHAILVVERSAIHVRLTELLRTLLHLAVLPGRPLAAVVDVGQHGLDEGDGEDLQGPLHGVERLAVLDEHWQLSVLRRPLVCMPAYPPREDDSVRVLLDDPVVLVQHPRSAEGLPSRHEDPSVGGARVRVLRGLGAPQGPADDLARLRRVVVWHVRPAPLAELANLGLLVREDRKLVAGKNADLLHQHLPDELLLPPALHPVQLLPTYGLRDEPAEERGPIL
mmetsp:Transcript_9221/g.29273  ORF Transcript_9221/g.29273 Transcript_9221/m.29273 type:complete len:236 (+) Transcript_9221:178-885(+)